MLGSKSPEAKAKHFEPDELRKSEKGKVRLVGPSEDTLGGGLNCRA